MEGSKSRLFERIDGRANGWLEQRRSQRNQTIDRRRLMANGYRMKNVWPAQPRWTTVRSQLETVCILWRLQLVKQHSFGVMWRRHATWSPQIGRLHYRGITLTNSVLQPKARLRNTSTTWTYREDAVNCPQGPIQPQTLNQLRSILRHQP